MPRIGTCKLCNTLNVSLQESHIVPEFFYKKVYTRSHKFMAVAQDEGERLAVEQKGYRERLLCRDCETKLSTWEGKLSQLTNELITDSFNTVTCTASNILNVKCLTGVDYRNVKMAILSIFWRMSLASHSIFKSYDLGPYTEKFRQILDQKRLPGVSEFPVLISKGLLDGQFHPGILFPVSRGRYSGHLLMQSVVLDGIIFDCVMTNTRVIPEEISALSLHPNGRVLVPTILFEERGMNPGEFSQRMKKLDVKNFYAKHS